MQYSLNRLLVQEIQDAFGSFDTKLDFNTYTINDKYSAQSKSVIVKVESFYDSSTGEPLIRVSDI